jgi:general secretion pathway protein F
MVTTTFSIEQLIGLNDEIASLVRGGVPLELGLHELGSDSSGALQEISQSLAARMSAGASLSEALHAEERRLPATYRTVVEAGVRAGRLPAALESISNYARELADLRRRITLALLYPFIVVVLAYLLFGVFIVQLVRRLRETYELFRLPVHWSLKTLSLVTEWVALWWWVPLLCFVAIVLWWTMTGGARMLTFSGAARPLAWIPYVGRITRYFQYANFADLLALMVDHQVPLPEGLRLTAGATGDARLRRSGRELAASIERSDPAVGHDDLRFGFPPFLYWVLTCGQTSGGLAKLLRHAASIYRRQGVNLSHWLKIVFPVVAAVVIGGGVTVLYTLSLFGPMAQLWNDLGLD